MTERLIHKTWCQLLFIFLYVTIPVVDSTWIVPKIKNLEYSYMMEQKTKLPWIIDKKKVTKDGPGNTVIH